MALLIKILFISLGFLLSINQGVSVIVGHLRTGVIIGADVFMPVDIPLYLLFLLVSDRSRETKVWFSVFFVKLLILVFYLLAFTGEFVAYDNGEFRFQLVHLSRGILIFYVIASRLNSKKSLEHFVVGLLLGLGVQSLVGFWQWQIGPVYIPYFKISEGYRVTGLLAVANAYGAYLITLLPLAIRVIFFTDIKPKWLWIIITIWSLGALYATFTRGAWLAFVGVMVLFSLRDIRTTKIKLHQKILFISLGFLFLVFMGAKYGGDISHRMHGASESLTGDESQSRVSLAKDALRIINDNKVFGVGLNNYRHHADYRTLGLRMVHNAYLLIAAEQGLIAAFLFVLAHLITLILGFKLLYSKDKLIFNIGTATLSGYVALLVYHLIAPDYRIIGVLMQHWRLLAMILALCVIDSLVEKQREARFRQLGRRIMNVKTDKKIQPQDGPNQVPNINSLPFDSGNIYNN